MSTEERLARLEERITHLVAAVDKLTVHVDSLRRWQAYVLGAGAVVGAVLSYLLTLVAK